MDKAAEQSESAAGRQYVPAIVNLGNVYLLQNRPDHALEYFLRAERTAPGDVGVLVDEGPGILAENTAMRPLPAPAYRISREPPTRVACAERAFVLRSSRGRHA